LKKKTNVNDCIEKATYLKSSGLFNIRTGVVRIRGFRIDAVSVSGETHTLHTLGVTVYGVLKSPEVINWIGSLPLTQTVTIVMYDLGGE
jgi:hypothetical protein